MFKIDITGIKKKKKEKEKNLKNKSVKVNQGIINKDMLVVHRKNT